MQLKFLKAGNGDSILIHHESHNILIDGGNDSKYMLEQITDIHKKGEKIDLLIITHHDDDHIKGIIDLLENVNQDYYGDKSMFIKQVIFNSPRFAKGILVPKDDRLLSYKQAHAVEEALMTISTDWRVYNENSEPILFGGLKIDFHSPTDEDIKEYSENKGAYLTSDNKCDWQTPMTVLEKYINDESQDNSLFNRNSIVITLEYEETKILLTGDVTPKRCEEIILKLVEQNGGEAIKYDYIKLPHHGSYRSLNKTIIENIKCQNFIISTNGKKHFLPNKRALLKILKHIKRDKNEKINFIFNYHETMSNLNITEKEKKDYNFSMIPNNERYGFII